MTDSKFAKMMNISTQTLRLWEKTRPGLHKVLMEYRNKIEHPLFANSEESSLTQKEIILKRLNAALDKLNSEDTELLKMQVAALKEPLNNKEALLFDFSTLSNKNQRIVLDTAEALSNKYDNKLLLDEKDTIEDVCVDEVDLYEAKRQMQCEKIEKESMVDDLINFDTNHTLEENNELGQN